MDARPQCVANPNRQLYALYLTRFAAGFGLMTLVTLLPVYINQFEASGLVLGLFVSAVTIAKTGAIVPLAWAGDRYDKRQVLLVGIGLGVVVYAAFALVASSLGFIGVRALQGVTLVATGLLSTALVGQLAPVDERANAIGKANAWRLAAGIVGALAAGQLYEYAGFSAVYTVVVTLMFAAVCAVTLFVDRDPTRVSGFPFSDLALNRRILTLTTFRAQYAFSVEVVRAWVPIYAGAAAATGGLAYGAVAVSLVVTAERAANMVVQPYAGRLSDRFGRALFVFAGGGAYGVIAFLVPFSPRIGDALALPAALSAVDAAGPAFVPAETIAAFGPAFLPLLVLSGLLGVTDAFREPASMALFADEGTSDGGVASSFGIRELVWRPGSVLGPMIAGVLTDYNMAYAFYFGGAFAITGAFAFLVVLWRSHGRSALSTW
ncbi:MFS transporter [Natronorubrum sp. JWXQ-INN-674]|uniref:MFS transporter n=1 Tax=Natronorubrum halalkaliphilum TaxID=2691917 RepID=A0A6B0VKS1_9EURY|nr:MFS transporter [Natronorubrum halalkaliphilum]MXV61715.1 MFS transporter [Natronorubrum halalkaliphilum]